MKRKIIALTVATAVSVATFSIAGCADSASAPRAMTENEWKAAWQASYTFTNYTAESEINIGNSTVSKADFENGNYDLPEIQFSGKPVKQKVNSTPFQIYGESIPADDDNTINFFDFVDGITYYHTVDLSKNGNWEISFSKTYDSEEAIQQLSENLSLGYSINAIALNYGISFEDSYSSFNYDSKTDSYSGTVSSSHGNDSITEVKTTTTLKFKDGKISEWTYDTLSYSDNGDDTISISRGIGYSKFYDIDKTVPITDEEFAKISALIKE